MVHVNREKLVIVNNFLCNLAVSLDEPLRRLQRAPAPELFMTTSTLPVSDTACRCFLMSFLRLTLGGSLVFIRALSFSDLNLLVLSRGFRGLSIWI